jgi:hypothetical protein
MRREAGVQDNRISDTDDGSETLVVDAVRCEPVSGPNSLLTGKRTGNFIEAAILTGNGG